MQSARRAPFVVKTVFSTANIHPRDRFDYWQEAARRMLVDHESYPECRLTFTARLDAAVFDDVSLVSFSTSSMVAEHTHRHLALAADEVFVCRQMTGSLCIEQNGNAITLLAGDMILFDPRVPYLSRFGPDTGLLVLKVPRRCITARVGPVADIVARRLRPVTGLCGLTSQFLGLLPEHLDGLGVLSAGMVVGQALDLFAGTVAETFGTSQPRLSSARLFVLTQLRAAVEQRLTDVNLTPGQVAAAAGVSVRYANTVLAAENTSLARLIQTRRLERCRQALADPLQSQRTIADIARRWGFSDMTHFARRFRSAYSMLPSEYRVQHGTL
jgi:AraC-like DNA-binding protein